MSYGVADLTFTAGCRDGAPPELRLAGDTAGSPVEGSAELTPGDCAKALRTARLGVGITIPVQPGVVLCVLTSDAAARERGISQKLAVLESAAFG